MKIWLTGITSAGNEQHLKELIEPIKDQLDGFCWVFHDGFTKKLDSGLEYLRSLKNSSVITSPWVRRTDHSRNKTLFEGPMKHGDWFFIIDTLERIHPEFVSYLIRAAKTDAIDGYFLEGKRLFFRYSEYLRFEGNPHEALRGAANMVNLELKSLPDYFWKNIRPEVRNKFHWVNAYAEYYFFPGTNHLFLGHDNNHTYVQQRYVNRRDFFNCLSDLGIDLTLEALWLYVNTNGANNFKEIFNKEKILNDWYRFNFLEARDIVDSHNPELIKPI